MNMRLRTEENRTNNNPVYSGNNGGHRAGKDSVLSSHDQTLFRMIGDYLTAMSDIEDVKNDPEMTEVCSMAVEMIRQYKEKPVWSRENEKFIRESFEKAEEEKRLLQEIGEIKAEAEEKGVSVTAHEWVNDWNRRKYSESDSGKIKELKDFVTGSLNNELSEPEIRYHSRSRKPIVKILRYITLPAAAAAGLFIVLRILSPPDDVQKIYSEMYQPLPVVTNITRGGSQETSKDNFSAGLAKYRKGDYYGASLAFSETIKNDSNSYAATFYQGITQVALGNYSVAVDLLEKVKVSDTEYGKDASWYLGLAYLKLGKKEKALEYLRPLSESPGFYREKARKIVRRLR